MSPEPTWQVKACCSWLRLWLKRAFARSPMICRSRLNSTSPRERPALARSLNAILETPYTCDLAHARKRSSAPPVIDFLFSPIIPGQVDATNNACERCGRPSFTARSPAAIAPNVPPMAICNPHRRRYRAGRVAVEHSNVRRCSDGFELGCDNKEKVRVVFALDCCDREAIAHVATTEGIKSEDVLDLVITAVENASVASIRFPSPLNG